MENKINIAELLKDCPKAYENNEHLLDTIKDCEEYYKTWENERRFHTF